MENINKKFVQAKILDKGDNFQEAKKIYEEILSNEPNNIEILLNYSTNLIQSLYYSEAKLILKKILNINPKIHAAWSNLGKICEEKENYKEAIYNFHQAIKINSDFATGYYNIGIVYAKIKEYSKSKNYLGFFAPYLERPLLLSFTPRVSSAPLTT